MKPLIFQTLETPIEKDLDFSLVEYSDTLNLNVLANTSIPAIAYINTSILETFTKAGQEGTDKSEEFPKNYIDSATMTLVKREESYVDDLGKLKAILDSSTLTQTPGPGIESTDHSKEFKDLLALLDTTTLTEAREITDQDN